MAGSYSYEAVVTPGLDNHKYRIGGWVEHL